MSSTTPSLLSSKPGNRDWHDLPPLPEALAGQFVGTSNNQLIVAGGSSWDRAPWNGGVKHWSDVIWVLDNPGGVWRKAGTLPQALAYGGSVSTPEGMLCIGGQNGNSVSRDVFRIRVQHEKARVDELRPLPEPVTNSGASLLADAVYVACGQSDITSASATQSLLRLTLADIASGWQKLPALPGSARILPAITSDQHSLYVFSGANLYADHNGAIKRKTLTDSYAFSAQASSWRAIANVPRPVVAAPALWTPGTGVLIFGGDDGTLAEKILELKDSHPGFSRSVLSFSPNSGTFEQVSNLPLSLVTTNAVIWRGSVILAGGEDRPGHRSNKVIGSNLTK